MAQEREATDLAAMQAGYLDSLYYSATGADRNFINGTVYLDPHTGARGHPFFLDGNWTSGSLVMDGRSYGQHSLKYDIYSGQLIYNFILESGPCALVLNKTGIDNFTLDGHTFRRLNMIPGVVTPADAGYFEVITDGMAGFYIKWEKRYKQPTAQSPGEFVTHKDRYILNRGSFYRVNRRWGLLRALGDRKKEIRAYIRERRLVIAPGHEEAVKEIVDYYNTLQ
jgi:hypothetical protein